MSVELFFEDYPANSRLRERFVNVIGDNRGWPLLSHFVKSMITEANRELRNFSDSFRSGYYTPATGTSIEAYIYYERKREIGAVLLGNSIYAINDSIWNGQVDLSAFYSDVNAAFSGTVIEAIQLTQEAKRVDLIDQQKHDEMIDAARWDKTLAIFLRYPELLPEKMQSTFCDEGVINAIGLVLPDYEKRAKLLVANPTRVSKVS